MNGLDELVIKVLAFYKQDTSPFTISIWCDALSCYDIKQVSAAFSAYTRRNENFRANPTPADIVKLIEGSGSDQASRAWEKVDKAVRTVGGYKSVIFDDPIIHLAIEEVGGWGALNNQDEETFKFTANHFKSAYKGHVMSTNRPAHKKHLVGFAEAENSSAGRKIEPPVLLGDQNSAMLTYKSGDNAAKMISHSVSFEELASGIISKVKAVEYKPRNDEEIEFNSDNPNDVIKMLTKLRS